jgi:hypothetical protein
MYDGHSNPKQFLMSYDATISSYEGNAAIMKKSFVMAVRSVGPDIVLFSPARENHVVAEA